MKGWVYILSNESLEGLVKIGFSTKDPEGDMPKIIRILSDSGAHIQRIETDKSSLEDVFLNLTGKGINK